MKKLLLLTNEFPYGTWEPYLETEIKYYNKFKEVVIFALQLRKEHTVKLREVNNNIKVIPIYYAKKIIYLLYVFRTLFDKNLYKELKKKMKTKKKIKKIVDLFIYFSRAHYEADQILKKFSPNDLKDSVFYSYRFEYQPYVAILLNQKLKLNNKIIARAHRYDLYEERRKNCYIPCREILLENLYKVYPCSNDGTIYLKNKFPNFTDKIETSYLGTEDYGIYEGNLDRETFCIVSCSNVVPVKRIDKIIEVLQEIKNYNIVWTHYGDGVLMNSLKEKIKRLPLNISVSLEGNIENKELLKKYKEKKYHLFLNVSSSEGIPVSIMEANSFGIPCIATNVGGTGELIVNGENGYLIESNFKIVELKELIVKFIEMPEEEYNMYRDKARKLWNNKFNARINYQNFINILKT